MGTAQSRYDYALSVGVAAAIGAELYRCWRNAALAVLLIPKLFPFGTYVEGWIVIPRQRIIEIIEHGWCIAADQRIVDPTIVLMEHPDQPVFYFPGFQLSRGALGKALPGSTLPLVCHAEYGEDGMRHEGYRQGFAEAWNQALEEAEERHLARSAIKVRSRDPRRGITLIIDPPPG